MFPLNFARLRLDYSRKGEPEDVFDPEHEALAQALREYKGHLLASYEASDADRARRRLPSREEEKALRELGYIE